MSDSVPGGSRVFTYIKKSDEELLESEIAERVAYLKRELDAISSGTESDTMGEILKQIHRLKENMEERDDE